MIAPPSSRRFRIFGAVTVITLIITVIHLRPQWRLEYARDYYENVTKYFNSSTYNNTLHSEKNDDYVHKYYNSTDQCASFPSTDGVMLVMKTGATESYDRLPTQLLTTLSCLPDMLLFSDMEQQIGPHHIYDALAEVDEEFRSQNGDFDLYRAQQDCPVSQKQCIDPKEQGSKAWVLDKYKFMPMLEQTWLMRPGRDWYIFAEADTYVFWENLMYWLRHESGFDPHDKIYLGSRSFIGGRPFAHGGSGYIVSGTLLKHLIEFHRDSIPKLTEKGPEECCGDLLVALAFNDYEEIKIRQTWPMINGEKPTTLPYGNNHWCEPILTMHHMNSEEISNVWQFEKSRKTRDILMIKDLYESLIAPKMKDTRENWNNLSDDVCYLKPDKEAQDKADGHDKDRQRKEEDLSEVEKNAWKSPEDCAKVCESEITGEDANDKQKNRDRKCFQYRWHDDVCCTSKSFKFGEPKAEPKDDSKTKWTSGWYLKGIEDWIDAKGPCDKPAWKVPEE
ncbi:glycosyltransferase family 31 protein [Xylariaceae sp. FL1272]|nr:glycosyltransferase family 31 protein [Xylariaceae sp. FL1272]